MNFRPILTLSIAILKQLHARGQKLPACLESIIPFFHALFLIPAKFCGVYEFFFYLLYLNLFHQIYLNWFLTKTAIRIDIIIIVIIIILIIIKPIITMK